MTISSEKGFTYQIELNDPQARRKTLIGLLFSFLAIIIFLTRWETAAENYYIDFVIAFIIIAGLVYNRVNRKPGKNIPPRFFFFTAAAGMGLLYPFNILSIPYMLLAFIEGPLSRKQIIEFSNEGVVINSWKKKFHPWKEFQSALLKDGLLTLDFKNNHILQRETAAGTVMNESDFNVWCAGCIHQAGFINAW